MQSRFTNWAPSFLESDETISFSKELFTETSSLSEEPFYITFNPSLKTTIDTIDEMNSREFKSIYTEKVRTEDIVRAKLYRSAISLLEDDVKFADIDPEAAEIASTVLSVFGKYPVEVNGGYNDESIQLGSLFTGLDEISDTVTQSSAAKRITALRASQAKFDEYRATQLAEKVGTLRGKMSTVLNALEFKIDGSLNYLEMQAMIHGGEYEAKAVVLEEMINRVMTPARARETRKSSIS